MSTEIIELNQRLERLEFVVEQIHEMLSEKLLSTRHSSISAERGAFLIAEAKRNARKSKEHFDKLFRIWEIREQPIGRQKLHELYKRAGFGENDTQFANGIIEMREE